MSNNAFDNGRVRVRYDRSPRGPEQRRLDVLVETAPPGEDLRIVARFASAGDAYAYGRTIADRTGATLDSTV
jgi:hypothetical protein